MNKREQYEKKYAESIEVYNKMIKEYKDLTESADFREIAYSMPFEFLNASHICQSLQLFADMSQKGENTKMSFTCAEDAVVFYKNLLGLKNKKETLLNGATYLCEVAEKVNQINEFVMDNPYLGKSFCVQGDADLFQSAKRCLEEIPKYKENMTKKFRYSFLESAIECSSKEDLQILIDSKVIAPMDLDHVCLSGSEEYNEKIQMLCERLGHTSPLIASYELNLVGVAFTNDDGVKRQDLLEQVKALIGEKKDVTLKAESFTYVPEIGKPEPAVRVLWDGQVLGFLDKHVAREITEKYENPQFSVKLKDIVGGGSSKKNPAIYGCKVEFGIIAPKFKEAEKEEDAAEKAEK